MNNYHLTNKAVGDLSDIWEYTLEAWSEDQADSYYEMLIDSCSSIANEPKSGKIYTNIAQNLFGYRVGRHIIFYRTTSPSEVEITRILHERMDLKSRIRE
ncbi:MAG: type II toxin-antitoxin system RelE/ParE family toxin [Cyclobacteriaceae bacterium]